MTSGAFPLSTPDLGRMPLIQAQLAEREPADEQLREHVAELQRRYDEAMEREAEAEREGRLEGTVARDLAQELEEQRQELHKATAAALDPESWHLRNEWLQLQVLRSFMPPCMICGRPGEAVHVVRESRGVMCLDCFDAWVDPDLEALEGDVPASFDVDRLAAAARDRESRRRQALAEEGPPLRVVGADEIPQESQAERRCWHCGGSTTRAPLGHEWDAVEITLGVMALVPNASQPEEGRVCLECLAWEVGRVEWKSLGQVLQDPERWAGIKAEAAHRRTIGS